MAEWTDLEFESGAPLTAAEMNALQANIAATAQGAVGAPEIRRIVRYNYSRQSVEKRIDYQNAKMDGFNLISFVFTTSAGRPTGEARNNGQIFRVYLNPTEIRPGEYSARLTTYTLDLIYLRV